MLQFLLPLLMAGAGAGIGAATASGKKGSRGRGALKGALAGGALGLGGVGLTGLGMGGGAAAAGAAGSAPLAAGAPAMSLAGGGVGTAAGTPLAAQGSGMMGNLGMLAKNPMVQQMGSGMLQKSMEGPQFTPVAEMGGMSAPAAMSSAASVQMSNPLSFANVDPSYLAMLRQKMQQQGSQFGGY